MNVVAAVVPAAPFCVSVGLRVYVVGISCSVVRCACVDVFSFGSIEVLSVCRAIILFCRVCWLHHVLISCGLSSGFCRPQVSHHHGIGKVRQPFNSQINDSTSTAAIR